MKRHIGLITLSHAIQRAPQEIADIASREFNRQVRTFGLSYDTPPEVERLKAWLKVNKRPKVATTPTQ